MKCINLIRTLLCALLVAALAWFVLGEQLLPPSYGPLVTAGGSGTADDPFLIENAEQLASFRDSVNSGYPFNDCYFRQTADVDLSSYQPWTPIGESDSSFFFAGTYDGDGHVISNLYCDGSGLSGHMGLFGQLGGTVANLGIASGRIEGAYVGSIASHSYPSSPAPIRILNCYSFAELSASQQAGGLVNSFRGGYLGSCWFGGTIDAPSAGGVAHTATGLYLCSSLSEVVADEAVGFQLESDMQDADYLTSSLFVEDINGTLSDTEAFYKLTPGMLVEWEII